MFSEGTVEKLCLADPTVQRISECALHVGFVNDVLQKKYYYVFWLLVNNNVCQ